MKDPAGEARRWMAQAHHDLEAGRANSGLGYHALACYLSQQAAEKALKAVLYAGGERWVPGHSVAELLVRAAESHPELLEFRPPASALDKLYIPTRYPNGLPGGVPAESYSREDAEEALTIAATLVQTAGRLSGMTGDQER